MSCRDFARVLSQLGELFSYAREGFVIFNLVLRDIGLN
jgi:hypothetical protein